jgi:Winged helix DNA-binding domain
MTGLEIAQCRLKNQHIFQARFERPEDVVAWLGAVQAQDYGAAKWAVGLRLKGAKDDMVEQAFTTGSILRTHLLRPTWHFVAPADIRWMLALTAPRVHAANAYYYRKLELDQRTLNRSRAALIRALQGGCQLTRDELRHSLTRSGVATHGQHRMAYIMMSAELNGLVCSGARRGKQFTYTLLDERVPNTKTMNRLEALSKLVKRFFMSHGPATVQDFVKWSGLSTADAKCGLEEAKAELNYEVVNGRNYWFATLMPPAGMKRSTATKTPTAFLLPNYDEYTIGYKNHSVVFDVDPAQLVFNHLLVVNGLIVGTWKRTVKKDVVVITSNVFTRLTKAETSSIATAARKYGAFLNLPVVMA